MILTSIAQPTPCSPPAHACYNGQQQHQARRSRSERDQRGRCRQLREDPISVVLTNDLVITGPQIDQDIGLLDTAWRGPATFALIPAKADPAWISDTLSRLPPDLQTGHFALLTSGVTGRPKLVIGNRRRSESLAVALHAVQSGDAALETIVTLPLTYCFAFVNQWLWARVTKRRLILTKGFSEPAGLAAALDIANRAMLCLVGAQVPLLRQFMDGRQFPGVVRLHFAGGRFPQEYIGYLSAMFPNARIFNNYGCAEAMPRLTLRPAAASDSAANIGRPLPGVELRSASDRKLLFRSPFRAVAYCDGERLHRIGDDEWIETGDLGYPVADGSWELEGRANEVFKRYGEKVSLPQLMSTVQKTWTGEAAFYREVGADGEEGCVLVLAPNPTDSQLRMVLRTFRAHWPRPHWPLRIEGMERLPLLSNRKIDTHQLASAPKTTHWRQRI